MSETAPPPPLDATVWAEAFDLQTFTFTDQELQDLLGQIEQKARGGDGLDLHEGLDLFDTAAASGPGPLPLQFQPHDPAVSAAAVLDPASSSAAAAGVLSAGAGGVLPLKREDGAAAGTSGTSSFAPAGTSPEQQQQQQLQASLLQQQLMAGQAPPQLGGVAGVRLGLHGPQPTTAMLPPPANGLQLGQGHLQSVMAAAYAQGATSALHLPGTTSGTTPVPRYSSNGTTTKGERAHGVREGPRHAMDTRHLRLACSPCCLCMVAIMRLQPAFAACPPPPRCIPQHRRWPSLRGRSATARWKSSGGTASTRSSTR